VSLATLRQQIAEVLAADAPATPALPTGLAALDAALGGGLPRGRLSELLGAPGSGVTALARHVVTRALAEGTWVAVIDATRTLAPRDWRLAEVHAARLADAARGAGATGAGGLWVVRPPAPARGAWCADVLLRSGAFGLVVLDGAPPLTRPIALRLVQLARESDAALLVVGHERRASELGGAVRLRIESATEGGPRTAPSWTRRTTQEAAPPAASAMRRSVITVEKGGTHRTVEVSGVVGVARRLCAHPEVPDRRDVAGAGAGARDEGSAGAAARVGVGAAAGVHAGAPADAPPHADGSGVAAPVRRARRCAEPRYERVR